MKSCPWVKFIFFNHSGEIKRIGPRTSVGEFCRQFGREIEVIGMSFRGRGKKIFHYELFLDLGSIAENIKVHEIVLQELTGEATDFQIDN